MEGHAAAGERQRSVTCSSSERPICSPSERCAGLCAGLTAALTAGLIETLSEDRASLMQEKKQLEEELNRLRSTALVSSAFFPSNASTQEQMEAGAAGGAAAAAPPAAGACSSESAADGDRLASVAAVRDEEQVDSAVEASLMTVQ